MPFSKQCGGRNKTKVIHQNIVRIMKKNLFKCWGYEKPEIAVIGIEPCSSLLEGSGSGGHNKSGDDGDDLNAKQGWFDDEETEN